MSAIGHRGVFRLSRWSCRIQTGFLGPRSTWDPRRELATFRLPGYHRLCRFFPKASSISRVFDSLGVRQYTLLVPQPHDCNSCRISRRHGLASVRVRSPLLTESRLFSLPVGTEMFHFPTFPPTALYIQAEVTGLSPQLGFPIQKSPGNNDWLASPRGLSQPPTSFIGSRCQGIHRMHLLT